MHRLPRIWIYIGGVCALVIFAAGIILFALPKQQEETYEAPPKQEEQIIVKQTTIGTSVAGRSIEAYTFGTGDTHILFVGGIHGGYEWNSVFLAYRFIDYLSANPDMVPDTVTISVIPSANPDGLFAITGTNGRFSVDDIPDAPNTTGEGRFNANEVDINRNFDCKWQSESTWRGSVVSAGDAPFSEPEAKALQDFVLQQNPASVIFWHSQGGAVYASECEEGILPQTLVIMNAYANASGYTSAGIFDAYPITGDAEGYLASIGIPAVTVELSTHMTIEWEKNLAGIQAVLDYYSVTEE